MPLRYSIIMQNMASGGSGNCPLLLSPCMLPSISCNCFVYLTWSANNNDSIEDGSTQSNNRVIQSANSATE